MDLADRVACVWWTTSAARTPSPGATEADDGRDRTVLPDVGGRRPRPTAALAVREVASIAAAVIGGPPEILPDGCVDLVWHDGVLSVAGADTRARPAGPADGATLGVRLRPGAATTLGESAAALRDRHPRADEVWGTTGARLSERVEEATDDRARLALLVAALRSRALDARPTDPVVDAAVRLLGGRRATVAGVAAELGVGERLLRRRFLAHVGYGPKTLHRVLRLQRFLTLAIGTDEDLAGLAALSGHGDQAHLTRETRSLAGATPAELVRARRPPVGTA